MARGGRYKNLAKNFRYTLRTIEKGECNRIHQSEYNLLRTYIDNIYSINSDLPPLNIIPTPPPLPPHTIDSRHLLPEIPDLRYLFCGNNSILFTFNIQPKYVLLNNIETCSVCLEELSHHGYETNCHHVFHENCINNWLKIKNVCPICRIQQCM
jgi:hypothetical protein